MIDRDVHAHLVEVSHDRQALDPPTAARPQDALDYFLRTKMDVLVLGDWFIGRNA